MARETRLNMIDKSSIEVSLSRQFRLFSIPKSSYYYYRGRVGIDKNCYIKQDMLEIYKSEPTYGVRRLKDNLRKEYGWKGIGEKKVSRCMKELGIKALYPRKRINTSAANKRHRKYPYLLRDLEITHSNQAWATDITYTGVKGSRAYVVAVEDLFSRKILSWKVSNTMDTSFCIDALEEALRKNGKPEIFNTDQGSQFTSEKFTSTLLDQGVKISMDGKGRALDNAHIERVWRSLKYEDIYLNDYQSIAELRKGVNKYFKKYNNSRPHQSLNYEVPNKVYAEGLRRIKR